MKGRLVVFLQITFLLLITFGCSERLKLKRTESRLYSITDQLPVDSSILAFYKPYKMAIDSQINAEIGIAAVDITAKRPEGLLNNLLVDAMAEVTTQHGITFDFAHANYKSLRISIPKGKIKAFKIFEMMPFENNLVTVKLDGPTAKSLFDYMAEAGGDPIAGASYRIEKGKAVDIRIKGSAFDITQTYIVLTNDYLANGGDKALVYKRGIERQDHAVRVRDAIFNYIKQQTAEGKSINPTIEGRVTSDKPEANE